MIINIFFSQSLVNLRPRRSGQVEVRETELGGSVDLLLSQSHHTSDIQHRSKSVVSVERGLDADMVVVGI